MTARDLSNHLAALLRKEQGAMADFLLALAAFDRDQLWRELGHASLFSYLRRELGLSAGAAQYRKTAVELVRRFPEVEAALREGRLCLTTIVEVARVLTPENLRQVLPRFFGLSRREAEVVSASIRPAEVAPRRDVVSAVRPAAIVLGNPLHVEEAPAREVRPAEVDRRVDASAGDEAIPVRPAERDGRVPASRPLCERTKPLDAEIARLHVTVSRRFLEKLQAAKDALSHARPGAGAEEILEAGLDLLLAEHAKRKGLVEKPRKASRPSRTDAVPAHVKRAVWIRAGGRCEWRFDSGEVCGSTVRLELDHVVPRALGGPSTIDNVRVTCNGHNQLAARRVFGDACIDRYTRKVGEAGSPRGASP
jgi:5-methylcytosine-specific restriction endonuclease McrA